ncbi:MAG: ABC transporter substrate-binding protein [Anaerolineae bacterium]|nr:ABC transporter substrate-binding protein [Anaerolineae bacterium]
MCPVWRRCVALVLLLVALWGLPGCQPARADLAPRSTLPLVKIGLVAPFEGRYRALGYEALYAVKWAVQERNVRGGAGGNMVELVALNDDDEPSRSAFQASKLGVDGDVVGAIGPFSDAAWRASAPVYAERGVPLVAPVGCALAPTAPVSEGVFCMGPDPAHLARALLGRAGARTALLRSGESSGVVGELLAPHAGGVYQEPWDVAALAALPVDGILFDGDVLSAAGALTAIRGAGIEAPLWGGPALGRVQLPQIAGRSARNTCYAVTAPVYADVSPQSAFVTGYRALSGTAPGPWAALAYDAASLLLDAIDRAAERDGVVSRAGVGAALAGAEDEVGRPLWIDGRRAAVDLAWYCYDGETSYPGREQEIDD